tara:strand:- start:161 stop:454 length:294 start_codon:yes stop_codon:yes gene_type:complete
MFIVFISIYLINTNPNRKKIISFEIHFICLNKRKSPLKKSKGLNVPGNVLLSHAGFPRSTIGAVGLNCRVRDGIGCFPHAIVTGKNFWKLDQAIYQE